MLRALVLYPFSGSPRQAGPPTTPPQPKLLGFEAVAPVPFNCVPAVMVTVVALLIIVVQALQSLGDLLVRRLNRS